jgi:hypothetical protein
MYKNFSGTIDLTLSGMTIKDECANLVVETNMEGATLISIQLEITTVLVATAPSFVTTIENLKVNVRIEEIEAPIMEE